MPLSRDVRWVRLHDIGRIVALLQENGFTYAEMANQSGVKRYLLEKAKTAYAHGDMKTVTDERRVIGLTRMSLEDRKPTPQTYVSAKMERLARRKIETLLRQGLTKQHIIRSTGLSNDVVHRQAGRMTFATYEKIMGSYADLAYDAEVGIGTTESVNRMKSAHISDAKYARQKAYLKPIRDYVAAHPNALPSEIAHAVGITPARLRSIDRRHHVLPKNASRNARAQDNVRRATRYMRKHPDAKGADIAELLGVTMGTAYRIRRTVLETLEGQADPMR